LTKYRISAQNRIRPSQFFPNTPNTI